MSHVCHAVGCNTPVAAILFMCTKHWYKLPKVYQKVIWHYYRPGQEIDKEPTLDYIAVAFAGIACVALQEGRTPPRFVPEAVETAQRAHETVPLVSEEPNQAPIEKEMQ